MRRFRLIPVILAVVAIAAYGIWSLTSKSDSPTKSGGRSGGSSNSAAVEDMYAELDSLISRPDQDETDLTGKFTFTTYVSGESFEEEFDDDPGVTHVLQESYISRSEKGYLLDVMKLSKPLEPEKYYRVTGTVEGSIYWTEDNKKVSMLHIIATDADPFEPAEGKVNKSATYLEKNGDLEYTFLGAHHTTVLNSRKAIVVYFDFKNNSSKDDSPSMYDLYFYQGNGSERLSSTVMSAEELDSSALNASKAGITDKTYAGKTSRYCAVYTADSEVTEDEDVLWLVRYNDDFELMDDIGIPVSKDLATLQAGE